MVAFEIDPISPATRRERAAARDTSGVGNDPAAGASIGGYEPAVPI